MNIILLKKLNLAVFALLFAANFSQAQPFIPDKTGHVYDSKFREFIKSKGYELVGSFDVMQQQPLIAYAKVLKNGVWITIDTYGKVVLNGTKRSTTREIKGDRGDDDNEFDPFKYVHPSNEGLQIIQKDKKYGLNNAKTNKIIIPVIYDELQLTNFKFVAVKQNGKWGTVTKQGHNVMPTKYDEVKSLGVNMAHTNYITGDAVIMRTGNKWGLLSDDGKEIVSPQYDKIESSWIISSLLKTTLDKKKGLLNKSGQELSKPIYTEINDFNSGGVAVATVGPFNSLSYGLVDTLGKQIIKPVYKNIGYLGNTLFTVYEENYPNARIALYNIKGRKLTGFVYKSIGIFRNNAAMIVVSENGHDKEGCIDSTGREVIKPIYDYLEDNYGRGIYYARINSKYGLLNSQGEYLAKPIYDEMQGLDINTCIVKKENKYGLIDKKGELLVPLKYESNFNYRGDGLISTFLGGKRCTVDLYGNEYFN